MAHAEHFLGRLERLEEQQVELALRLYYDHRLVAHVLRNASLPDDADRIALSLGDDQDGPFLIVTRDGKFVTCLGQGMKHDRPIITRHKLDALAERVDSLRTLVSESKADGHAYTRRLLKKVIESGDRLSREEFEHLAGWLPIMVRPFFQGMISAYTGAGKILLRMLPVKRIGHRYDQALREYWRASWAVGHFALLLGTDNGEALGKVLVDEASHRPLPSKAELFPWILTQLGVSAFAARGAWVASKLPKLLFPDLKDAWDAADTTDSTIAHGLGLAAIGLRHAHRRAEVGKALRREPPPVEGVRGATELAKLLGGVREMIAAYYEAGVSSGDELRAEHAEMAKMLLSNLADKQPPGAAAWYRAVPEDAAIALFLSMPIPLVGDYVGLDAVLRWLPWIVRADAADFYLPEAFISMRRAPWQRSEGLVLMQPRLDKERIPARPAASEGKPGRNEPCPCGSGRKYKRCCGDPAASDRDPG